MWGFRAWVLTVLVVAQGALGQARCGGGAALLYFSAEKLFVERSTVVLPTTMPVGKLGGSLRWLVVRSGYNNVFSHVQENEKVASPQTITIQLSW